MRLSFRKAGWNSTGLEPTVRPLRARSGKPGFSTSGYGKERLRRKMEYRRRCDTRTEHPTLVRDTTALILIQPESPLLVDYV